MSIPLFLCQVRGKRIGTAPFTTENNTYFCKKDDPDKIFSTKKTYTSENWSWDIYKIRLVEDILATGQSSTSGTAIQEWYTVVEENDELKFIVEKN